MIGVLDRSTSPRGSSARGQPSATALASETHRRPLGVSATFPRGAHNSTTADAASGHQRRRTAGHPPGAPRRLRILPRPPAFHCRRDSHSPVTPRTRRGEPHGR